MVARATVAAFVVTLLPLESFNWTVIVVVDDPFAVTDDDPAEIVDAVVDGPLTVKVTDPVVALL